MQLILNTETTADTKTKMSLNEENLEKCVPDIISIVKNGDLSNGDYPDENIGAGDSNTVEKNKLNLKTLENKLNIADGELKQVVNDVNGSHIDIEIPETKVLDETDKILDVTEKETVKNEDSATLPNSDKENEIPEKNVSSEEEAVEEEETLLILSDSDLNIGDCGNKSDMDACESVVVEEKCPENLNSKIAECDNGNNFDESPSESNKNGHTELATIVREIEICDKDRSADTVKSITVNEENETAIDTNAKEICNDIGIDVNLNLSDAIVDTDPVCNSPTSDLIDSDNIIEDDIINTMDQNGTVDNTIENKLMAINDTTHVSECEDEILEKEPIAISTEKTADDERMVIDSDDIVDGAEDEMKTGKEMDEILDSPQIEKAENEPDGKLTDKMDISEESISMDCNNVADNNKEVNQSENQCLLKNIESKMLTDPVENKNHLDGDCVTENENSKSVDEHAVTEDKEEPEINLSTSPVDSPSNFNNTADLTVDCSKIEPVTTRDKDTVSVVPDSYDDVIFNVDDDDKEPSTEIVAVNEKNNSEIGNDKMTENISSPVAEHSEDIIDLDEAGSKSVKSDSKTPDHNSEDLHKITTDKVSEPLKPLVGSDDIIDLNDTVTKPKTSDTKTLNQISNERQDDAAEKISEVVPSILKLSNTLDILSDDEEEPKETNSDNKCINIEDDDDIMLIDDDTSGNESKTEQVKEKESESENKIDTKLQSSEESMEISKEIEKNELSVPEEELEKTSTEKESVTAIQAPDINDKVETKTDTEMKTNPLLHEKFLRTCKKNLADMTREELEEFCVLKIVESILDRSNLSEIRTKLKTITQNIDEYKKKAMMLTKQNRDLQVVLKSIQEDQKKGTDSIVPLKITRSVGMQVLMGDKSVTRRKPVAPPPPPINKLRNPIQQGPRPQKPTTPQKQSNPQIPVPRLVPANNPTLKSPTAQQTNPGKTASPVPNGIRAPSPAQKGAEKRSHNRIQSVTVDLTDDEPPAKVMNRAVPVVPPVRLVPSQNLLAPPRQAVVNSSPRKVYIPISGPQGQNVRPGQTIMLKTVPTQGPRQRCPPPHMVRMPQTMRMPRPQGMRHPAPLPDCVKQYQPPNWKALPPAPDLKLAKVENGIVISWKIEGYQEDSYEEIASYQLYAYQETSSPPNTALWKKIGDVKALPLPMACTLTQFMAGYKYYFAVRALDIRSRLGPFSLPGSILLLNKM